MPFTVRRDPSIDTLRAIACIALVSFHTVGSTPYSGMELTQDHALSLMNAALIDMRMPLFSFLSGLVFVTLEHSSRSMGHMLRVKMRRLLVPMVSVGLIFWCLRAAMGQDQGPVLGILVLPFAHFWFLQATFLIMAVFLALSVCMKANSKQIAALLMGIGSMLWLVCPRPAVNVFSVSMAVYLMPFFMLGYLCAQTNLIEALRRHVPRGACVLMLAALVGLGWALAQPGLELSIFARRLLTLCIGAVFCLSLLHLSPRHSWLAKLGGFSYAIYLFHVFFTAGLRDVLMRVAPQTPDLLQWSMCLTAGLMGPVVVYHLLARKAWLATVFLGVRAPVMGPWTWGVLRHSRAAQLGSVADRGGILR